MTCPMGDLQMLPLHTKVTWSGRGGMRPIQHPTSSRWGGWSPIVWRPLRPTAVGGGCDGGPMTTNELRSPEDLGRRCADLIEAGDLDGLTSLYAADAVVSLPDGREAAGSTAIRAAFAAALASGADLTVASVGTAIVAGTLACTTSTTATGAVLTQVARREPDGTWRWVRDGHRLLDVSLAPAGECLVAVA